MKIGPLIQITQTPALLGLNISHGHTEVRQPKAELSLRQPPAQLTIEQPSARLEIDLRQVKNDLGIGSVLDLGKQLAQAGLSAAQQAAAEAAQSGDSMMNQPDVIPQLAAQANWSEVDYNIGLLPKHRPEINFIGDARPTIQAQPQAPQLSVTPRPPEINVQRAAVNSYLRQQASVQIDYIGPRLFHA